MLHADYHGCMWRRWVSFVVVLVLVLRGLAGVAMAAQEMRGLVAPTPPHGMATPWQTDSMAVGSDLRYRDQHTHHAGHDDHGAPTAPHLQRSADLTTGHYTVGIPQHGGQVATKVAQPSDPCHDSVEDGSAPGHDCSSCEICHSPLLLPAWSGPGGLGGPGLLHNTVGARFKSAPAASAIRPPIAA